jgi:hypothetical protein
MQADQLSTATTAACSSPSSATTSSSSPIPTTSAGATRRKSKWDDDSDQGGDASRSKKKMKGPKLARPNQCQFVVPPPKSRRCSLTAAPHARFCGIHKVAGELQLIAIAGADDATGSFAAGAAAAAAAPAAVAAAGTGQTPCPYCKHLLRQGKLAQHVRRCIELARLARVDAASTTAGAAGVVKADSASDAAGGNAGRSVGIVVRSGRPVGSPALKEGGSIGSTRAPVAAGERADDVAEEDDDEEGGGEEEEEEKEEAIPEEILEACRQRAAAKARQDFPEADRYREIVWAAGYVVEDRKTRDEAGGDA